MVSIYGFDPHDSSSTLGETFFWGIPQRVYKSESELTSGEMALPPHVSELKTETEKKFEDWVSSFTPKDKEKVIKEMKEMAQKHNKKIRKHHKDRQMTRHVRSVPSSDLNPKCSGHLCSVQVNLSRLKGSVRSAAKAYPRISKMVDFMEALEKHYLKALRLTAEESSKVRTHRDMRVEAAGSSVVSVPGDRYVRKATELLRYILNTNGDPFEAVVALAILTGRRSSEILRTISVRQPLKDDPKGLRKTHEQFWARMRGFLKHKPGVKIMRNIPILAPRKLIVRGLKYVRERLPSTSVQNCNSKYSTQINRRVKTLCAELKNLHTARRLYALLCHHYFRKDIYPGEIMSLPKTVAHVLGHTNLTKTSLTYMNIDLHDVGGIDYTSLNSNSPITN